jgi:hypothetical protein
MTVARFGLMALALCFSGGLLLAQAPLPIYVGTEQREEADPAVQESLRDLRRELGRTKGFRIVEQPDNASVILKLTTLRIRVTEESVTLPGQTVGGRTANGSSDTFRTPPETVPVQVERRLIETVVRFGSGEYTITAENNTSRSAAREIAKKLVALIQANGAHGERHR